MQIERHVQPFSALPHDPQFLVIQVASPGVRVDERTAQPKLADRALEFLGGGLGVLQRKCREPGEPVRVAGDNLGEEIVHRRGRGNRGDRVGLSLNAGRVQR